MVYTCGLKHVGTAGSKQHAAEAWPGSQVHMCMVGSVSPGLAGAQVMTAAEAAAVTALGRGRCLCCCCARMDGSRLAGLFVPGACPYNICTNSEV